VTLGDVLGPDVAHRQNPYLRHLPAILELDSMISHILRVPACSDSEQEAPIRNPVEAGDRGSKWSRTLDNASTEVFVLDKARSKGRWQARGRSPPLNHVENVEPPHATALPTARPRPEVADGHGTPQQPGQGWTPSVRSRPCPVS